MKNLISTLAFLLSLSVNFLSAQSVGINNDGSAPNASAIVDMKSTTQGMLPPRMTTAQRDAIAGPVQGLVVFNTEKNKLQTYNGTKWINADGSPSAIGEEYGGGIVFYIDETGQHGLIASTESQPSQLWGHDNVWLSLKDAGIGEGKNNTSHINNTLPQIEHAALVCANYTRNGYSDWFLPSLDEMKKLAENHTLVPNLSAGNYWTSTTEPHMSAAIPLPYTVGIPGGAVDIAPQVFYLLFRPIRAF